jgi:hypothetical protein
MGLKVSTAPTYIVFGLVGSTLHTDVGMFVLHKLPAPSKLNSNACLEVKMRYFAIIFTLAIGYRWERVYFFTISLL